MKDEINSIKFLKDAIFHFKGELNKFVTNPELGIKFELIDYKLLAMQLK